MNEVADIEILLHNLHNDNIKITELFLKLYAFSQNNLFYLNRWSYLSPQSLLLANLP